jgi:hypothetical protein
MSASRFRTVGQTSSLPVAGTSDPSVQPDFITGHSDIQEILRQAAPTVGFVLTGGLATDREAFPED